MLSNYEKWKLYTEALTSPESYITFGYYYMISAALQRRVFIGPDHARLFPNLYIILVGDPGVGKGLVIKQVTDILKFHKLRNPKENRQINGHEHDRLRMEAVAEEEYKDAQAQENPKQKEKSYDKPLLFPVAADATTYEALVKSLSQAIRRINYKRYDEKAQKDVMDIYSHSSLCFSLEEISSLFRKRTEDVVHFLIQAYDCGDYTYDTKTQGKDRIRKCCLNFFGGTTPSFMQSTFDDKLLTEGFASRTFFIFAGKNRHVSLWIPDLRQEQKQAHCDLLGHVERLSTLYGRVIIKPEDMIWLEKWWIDSQQHRSNMSIKLAPYYARKQIHVLKLAMAIHFGESLSMEIDRSSFERAIELLGAEEKNMHYALGLDNSNPLAGPARKILKHLFVNGRRTRKEIAAEFWETLPRGLQDLDEIIEYLTAHQKIEPLNEQNPVTKKPTIYYEARTNQ